MEYEYDDSVHLHLDYFGTECDMESIAYKRKNEDVWDVYFNFGAYGLQKDGIETGKFMDEYAGHYVFLYMLVILAGNLEVLNLKSGF